MYASRYHLCESALLVSMIMADYTTKDGLTRRGSCITDVALESLLHIGTASKDEAGGTNSSALDHACRVSRSKRVDRHKK